MQYTRLGSSGLKVSRIAMGAMSFGSGDSARPGWPLPWDTAAPLIRQALDLGITFWDTANGYNAPSTEERKASTVSDAPYGWTPTRPSSTRSSA